MSNKNTDILAEERVSNVPGVGILTALSHLDYKPWFALAEFIDNSIQSFQREKDLIRKTEGQNTKLRIEIDVDSALRRITITDNAGGISADEFPRALKPAAIPPNTKGLSEFGLGMKSAACWFADVWSVRTSAPGDPVERKVEWDITKIVNDKAKESTVSKKTVAPEAHYTVIQLDQVRTIPKGNTSKKIKEHLPDIYRKFLRDGDLELYYRKEKLEYIEPEFLDAPPYNKEFKPEPGKDSQTWKKQIDFDFGVGLKAKGFAGLLSEGGYKSSGFSLFRRGRIIEGSADEKYKPHEIFLATNSPISLRLFGELHLEGFNVGFTKDGFRWEENEDVFLKLLKEHLDSDDLPLLTQARLYRAKKHRIKPEVAREVVVSAGSSLATHAGNVISDLSENPPQSKTPPPDLPKSGVLSTEDVDILTPSGEKWTVTIRLIEDDARIDWIEVSEDEVDINHKKMGMAVNMLSPFMKAKVPDNRADILHPIVRLAAGLALAQILTRLGDPTAKPSIVTLTLNELLANSLSKD